MPCNSDGMFALTMTGTALTYHSAQEEMTRLQRNIDRARARARAKGLPEPTIAGSPTVDGSDPSASTPGPTGKSGKKAKNTEGTIRRCANCGQVGHIKTNKKSVSSSSSRRLKSTMQEAQLCAQCTSKQQGFGFGGLGAVKQPFSDEAGSSGFCEA